MNINLLTKWWWKLETEEGIWQDIVKAKYIKDGIVCYVNHKMDDSPVWADLLKVKQIYLQRRKVVVHNGKTLLMEGQMDQ